VRVEPDGIELEVKEGQTVFRVANELGLGWPTRCGGAQSCTMCSMVVIDGVDNLSAPDEDESFRVGPIARISDVEANRIRLACAARVRGPVVVRPRYPLGREPEGDEGL
jgi:ferredoxin, 2Fe-2S